MNRFIEVVGLSLTLAFVAQLSNAADKIPNGVGNGCEPRVTDGLDHEQMAKMEQKTRAVALKFFKSAPETQDEMLTQDARIWSLGIGEIDRSKWIELHHPKGNGPDRGRPEAYEQTINHVTVEGDRAAVDMENYVTFKDFTYDQKYHNLVVVRDGKVCLLKIFASSELGEKLLPDIHEYAK